MNVSFNILFQEELAALKHVAAMADFIMGMKQKLHDINVESFNSLIMKVGKCSLHAVNWKGPVTALFQSP